MLMLFNILAAFSAFSKGKDGMKIFYEFFMLLVLFLKIKEFSSTHFNENYFYFYVK